MATKQCTKCNRDKPLDEFHKDRTRRDGHAGQCKACKRAYRNSRYRKDRSRELSQQRRYRSTHKEKIAAGQKRRRQQRPGRVRRISRSSTLKQRYGITAQDYNRMLASQNGVCAVCGNPETRKKRGGTIRLAVDHCHKTGKVRGLLCSRCNLSIGRFEDDPELLEKAAAYLKATSAACSSEAAPSTAAEPYQPAPSTSADHAPRPASPSAPKGCVPASVSSDYAA